MKKVLLVIDDSLHRDAKTDAVGKGITLNEWLLNAIKKFLSKKD